MELSLKGKVALIVGVTGGIGSAIAETFHKCGATLVGIGRRDFSSKNIDYFKCDVSKTEDCSEIISAIIEKYRKIDILVNGAGIINDALTFKMTEAQFDEVIASNLKGVWNVTRIVGPAMQKHKSGSIINISSVVGIYGNIGQSNYAAAKAGIIGMTKTWAKEFSYNGGNVRVNTIAPGYTVTDMLKGVPEQVLEKVAAQTMLGRLAEPHEVANATLFLASDMSSYVTGTVLQVDGGMRL